LELLASLKLDVLIVDNDGGGGRSLATDVLRHPVLTKLTSTMRVVELPGRLWGCAGPGIVEAVSRLHTIADEVRAKSRPATVLMR